MATLSEPRRSIPFIERLSACMIKITSELEPEKTNGKGSFPNQQKNLRIMLFGCICRCFISNPLEIHTLTGCSKPMDPLLAWMVEVWHGQGARWEAKNAKCMLHPIQVDPILYKLLIVRYMLRAILFFVVVVVVVVFVSEPKKSSIYKSATGGTGWFQCLEWFVICEGLEE